MPLAAAFKVLVVDDQLTMREVTRLALQEIGIRNIMDAENGKTAFKVVVTQPVDMIISDFNMPELDGLGLLRAGARSSRRSQDAVHPGDGRGDSELVTKAAQAGVNNYIIKLFTAETLRGKIEAVVGKMS